MDKYLPVKNLTLVLKGLNPLTNEETCVFDIHGNNISVCRGIDIERINIHSENEYGYGYSYGYNYGYSYDFGYGYDDDNGYVYGYGYNYGYGGQPLTFEYRITLDTTDYSQGTYDTLLEALIGDITFTKSGVQITIGAPAQDENIFLEYFNGGQKTIDTGMGLVIEMNSTGSGGITVTQYNSNPETGFSLPALGKFFKIEASQPVLDGMGETELRVEYTDAEVSAAGIDESTLRLYYYNEISSTWEAYNSPRGGVNTAQNYVWALTNHFSTWGVFGEEETAPKTYSRGSNRFSYDPLDITYHNPDGDSIDLNGNDGDVLGLEGDDVPRSDKGFFSLFTGAVIGGGATSILVALIFLILVIGGLVIVIRRKRRKN